MNNLKRNVTKDQLIPCQVTYQGNDYSPITHKEVIETIGEYLYRNNFIIRSENYLSASNGQRAIGRIGIDCGDSEFAYEISWKNSLDGSMSFGLASGTHTFICSNGSVYGDISAYKRKHSGNANQQVLGEIEKTIGLLEDTVKLHQWRRDRLKEHEVSRKTIAELCGRLYLEEKIITSNQLAIIKGQMENPTFDYGCKDCAWEFYQNVTFATKETTPMFWHRTHQKVGDFFNREFVLGNPVQETYYTETPVEELITV